MGLNKKVVMPNGVTLKYHRIVSMNIITNKVNSIEVASYISKDKRDEEEAWYHQEVAPGEMPEPMNVYKEAQFISADYDQDMTIATAYDWLKKNIDMFKRSTDVLEEETE